MRWGKLAVAAVVLGTAFASAPAEAQRTDYGPFYVLDQYPDTIILNGPIAPGDALFIYDAVSASPSPRYVGLAGGGGSVAEAIVMAEVIRWLGLETYVFEGFDCAMPCPILFFAGVGRTAHGGLGIARLAGAPVLNAVVERVLADYDAPAAIVTAFRDLAEGASRTFTAADLAAMGADAAREDLLAAAAAEPPLPEPPFPDLMIDAVDVGDIQRAFLIVVEGDGQRRFFEAGVQWRTIADPEDPVLQALVVVPDLDLNARIFIGATTDPRYLTGGFVVSVFERPNLTPLPVPVIYVSAVNAIMPSGNPVRLPMIATDATPGGGLVTSFPTVLQPYFEELLTAAAQLELTFVFRDGRQGILTLVKGDPGEAALTTVMAGWRD